MHDQQGEVEEINVIDSMSVKCPDLITLIYTQTHAHIYTQTRTAVACSQSTELQWQATVGPPGVQHISMLSCTS